MEIHHSAYRHGVSSEDIRHAIEHAQVTLDMEPTADPPRVLLVGPDRASNLLEIVVLELAGGRHLAIHAMKLRPSLHGFLEGHHHG